MPGGVFMNSPAASALADEGSASRNRLVLVVYTAAIFVSALLLFSVQPLFTKMVLPRLGGAPAGGVGGVGVFPVLVLGGHCLAPFFVPVRETHLAGGVPPGVAGGAP